MTRKMNKFQRCTRATWRLLFDDCSHRLLPCLIWSSTTAQQKRNEQFVKRNFSTIYSSCCCFSRLRNECCCAFEFWVFFIFFFHSRPNELRCVFVWSLYTNRHISTEEVNFKPKIRKQKQNDVSCVACFYFYFLVLLKTYPVTHQIMEWM